MKMSLINIANVWHKETNHPKACFAFQSGDIPPGPSATKAIAALVSVGVTTCSKALP